MKTKAILLLMAVCFATCALAEDLLKARDWTSADGAKLNASLVETDGNTIKLKRTKDGKTFDLDASKLSAGDLSLIRKAIDKMDKKINSKDFGFTRQITEQDLDLALRLNKHEKLWEAASGCKLEMTPKRIIRKSENEAVLLGEHIAIRYKIVYVDRYKFILNGDKLEVRYKSDNDVKETLAERNKMCRIYRRTIIGYKREDINLSSLLTITMEL